MDSSPPDPAAFLSVRIVSIDYYMAPPIPDLDFCYSPLFERKVEEVPVIRIYGSTPAGQKTCLHIHRALPYLYIPCPSELLQNNVEADAFAKNIMTSIEKAFENRSTSPPKKQHVHGFGLVRAKNFYGYHSTEDLFLKIYLYYPHEVARAASFLLGGAVLSKTFQPFESHIPYLLQFLVDYNLFGMSHVHTSKTKFRLPLPDSFTSKVANAKKLDKDVTRSRAYFRQNVTENSAIWLTCTTPSALVWPDLVSIQDSDNVDANLVRRHSICELEADSSVDDILNEKNKIYTSLSQTTSEFKMVQSLLPIWEEYEQSGMREAPKLPDLSKPAPENVLKNLIQGFNHGNALLEFCVEGPGTKKGGEVEDINLLAGSGEKLTFREHQKMSNPVDDHLHYHEEAAGKLHHALNEAADHKNLSQEALRLLSWFASSQAADDINSDDDLFQEAILTPLVSSVSYKKALEMAHLDYEHASQQECQDILDSLEFESKSDELKERTAAINHEPATGASSDDTIPQVDGSSDDGPLDQNVDLSGMNKNNGRGKQSMEDSNSKNKLLWVSLPISTSPKEHEDSELSFFHSQNLLKTDMACSNSLRSEENFDVSKVNKGAETSHMVGMSLASCSVRDLMRRKRHFKADYAGSEKSLVNALSEMEKIEPRSLSLDGPLCYTGPDVSKQGSCPIFHTYVTSPPCMRGLCSSPVGINQDAQDDENAQKGFTGTQDGTDVKSNSTLDKYILQRENLGNEEFKVGINLSLSGSSKTCLVEHVRKTPLENLEKAFSRKPPSKDEVQMIVEDPSGDWLVIDDLLPFFHKDLKSYEQQQNIEDLNFNEESALGVPTYFQNDGSTLYLLTHAMSAPSFDSVCKWASEVVPPCGSNKITGYSRSFTLISPNSSTLLSNDFKDAEGKNNDYLHEGASHYPDFSSRDSCDSIASECIVAQVQSSISLEEKGAALTGSVSVPIGSSEPEVVDNEIKEDSLPNMSDDVSQISGPYEKSNLTPLSQIGFRDPASIGRGQQLTLVSLEVQAESRGNLRPDPQFDAINVVVIVVQEDTSPTFEIYVLMRGNNNEPRARNVDAISDCTTLVFDDEKHLLYHFVKIISSADPDVLMGWEIQSGSLGFLAERAGHLGLSLLKRISRTPAYEAKKSIGSSPNPELRNEIPETTLVDSISEGAVIEDEWGRTHASGIHVGGRIVLNLWRLLRSEVKLNMYSVEAVAEEVLRRKVPSIPYRILNLWFSSGPGGTRYRCIEYIIERAKLNLLIMNQMDMINRTSELARVFGIDFFSVLSRGSQYRVESMVLRLAHSQNYLAISPGSQQVALQPAMECLPLVMEPESKFYVDPVVVLDFQSLYPSMIIAYNLCYSTCLGKVIPSKSNVLGVSSYSADRHFLNNLKEQLLLAANGVVYVPTKVRKGVLPRLLEEILSTRIMVKQAMKKLLPSQQVLERILNARQLALKLIANVTYGYTAAGFSGRMPCAELADSIVQCGRRTLETAISYVNEHPKWNAKVVYGDTDSMFVLLKGRTLEAAFRIGNEIASAITAINPDPVTLKLEKVYKPCFLLTKKRYVGYSYESPDQKIPTFDAKGIETIRRDTCPAVAKILEQSIRLLFENQDISRVKSYLKRQWSRILSGKVSLQDFIFAKEVRLGSYSVRNSSLPPAAIVAIKAMNADPRAEPHYGERIPYVVIHGEPGARLIDMVVDPHDLLEIDSQYRLNDLYYINKQINPALQRVFGLLGADLKKWFMEMPRPVRPTTAKRHSYMSRMASSHEFDDNKLGTPTKIHGKRSRIDTYYISRHCMLCGQLVQRTKYLCDKCTENKSLVATAVVGRISKLEKEIQHLTALCRHCGGGGNDLMESRICCTSLACSIFYERQKVQKELQSNSTYAAEEGLYPTCMVEWF